jgi:hypothetical protein
VRIVLDTKRFDKPLEKPQMVMKKRDNISSNQLSLPLAQASGNQIISNLPFKEVKVEKRNAKVNLISKINFSIAEPERKSLKITPVPSTKNDKLNLFIEAFANSHRELYSQISKIQLDEKGLHLPEQDKVFFETVITRDSFDQFITTNEEQVDFVKQQTEFCWFRSPITEEKSDLFDGVNKDTDVGFDYKLKHTPGLSLSSDGRSNEKPLRDFLELSKLMKKGEKVIIQFGFHSCEIDWYKDAEKTTKELPKRIKVSESSRSKVGYNGFECSLRVIVSTSDKIRSETVSRGFITTLKQLNGDNELIEKKVTYKKFDSWLNNKVRKRKIPSHFSFKNRFILTHKEMIHFMKLPQRNLQIDYELNVKEREDTGIPKQLTGKGIAIGNATDKNKKIPVSLPTNNLDDFCKSYLYLGSPRTGKDTSIINFIVESVKNTNAGAVIPDVINEQGNDRGMADSIRDALPPDKVVDVDLGNFQYPLYFGMDDIVKVVGDNGVNLVANNLVKVLNLDELHASKQLARIVLKAVKCNIYDAYCLLKSDKYAEEIYKQLLTTDELLAMQLKHDYFDKGSSINQAKNAILSRLDDFLGNDVIKNMFAQEPNERFNLKDLLTQGKVVILRMNKTDVGEMGSQVLMYMLSLKIFWLKKMIHRQHPNQITFFVFNELFQYMSSGLEETIADMVVESPKYRLSFLFAFHHSGQISKFLWETLLSASLNFFLFKNTNFNVYRSLSEQLQPIPLDIAMKTERYESIFLPYVEGKQMNPLFVKMLAPPKDRMKMYDNSSLSSRHSVMYGTDIKEVKERIMTREISMYKKGEDG